MTHRTDRITLPDDEERCSALANPCRDKATCARYLAMIPKGGKLADYSMQRSPYVPFCPYFRKPRPLEIEPKKNEVKPWPSDSRMTG